MQSHHGDLLWHHRTVAVPLRRKKLVGCREELGDVVERWLFPAWMQPSWKRG